MTTMKEFWKVGELATLTGLTIRTLRYYDQINLFSPSRYTESGHRLYIKSNLTRLQQLLALKQIVLSLDEIKEEKKKKKKNSKTKVIKTKIAKVKGKIQTKKN